MKILSSILYCCLLALPFYGQTKYAVVRSIPLSGDGGYDYTGIYQRKLFISHGTQVQVLDLDKETLLGSIPAMGVHGIAFAPAEGKGYISNGKDTSVTVFDLQTLQVITKIKVSGANPDAILYEPLMHQIWTFNGKGKNASIIDAKENKLVGTLDLNARPEFAVADGHGHIFLNLEDQNKVLKIDAVHRKILASWPVAPGEAPSGLAMDTLNQVLFSVCDGKVMMVLDANSGKIISTLPIGDDVDACAYDQERHLVFSSNGEGSLTVVSVMQGKKYKVLENVPTQAGAKTMALDLQTHRIYLPVAEYEKKNPGEKKAKIKAGSFKILVVEGK